MEIYYDPILGMRYFFEPPVYLIDVADDTGNSIFEKLIYFVNTQHMLPVPSKYLKPTKGWIQQIEEAPVIGSDSLSLKEWNEILDNASNQVRTRSGLTVCGKHWVSDNYEIGITCDCPDCKTCRDFDKSLWRSMNKN